MVSLFRTSVMARCVLSASNNLSMGLTRSKGCYPAKTTSSRNPVAPSTRHPERAERSDGVAIPREIRHKTLYKEVKLLRSTAPEWLPATELLHFVVQLLVLLAENKAERGCAYLMCVQHSNSRTLRSPFLRWFSFLAPNSVRKKRRKKKIMNQLDTLFSLPSLAVSHFLGKGAHGEERA